MIEISIRSPGSPPQVRNFSSSRIRIGRDEDNEVVLADKSCSRHHAEILEQGGSYRIVDLGSANGVRVDGVKVAESRISDGLSVKLGESVLTFSLPASALDGTILLPSVADGTILLAAEQLRPQPPTAPAEPAPPHTGAAAGAQVVPASPAVAAVPAVPQPVPDAAAKPGVLYLNYRDQKEQKSFKVASGAEYVIGRSPNADLTLQDKKSSKRHAMIFSRDGRFFVRDLGSANKTFVNGQPVEESALAVDDEVRIGDAVFRVASERVSQDDEEFLMARTQLGLPSAEVLAKLGVETDRRPERPRRIVAVIAAASVLVLLGIAGALYRLSTPDAATAADEAAPRTTTVQVAPVEAKDLVSDISATGSIKAERTATVSSEVPGRVMDVLAEVGDRIERGQELVRLNDRDVRLQIQEARSSLTSDQVAIAREDYQRKQRLFENGVVTRSMLDQSKNGYLALESNYQSLQAKIGLLEEQLAKARVLSPIAGVVAQRSVDPGEVVGPGAPLFVVDGMDEVLLEAALSDRDIVKVRQGQSVEVTSDAFQKRTFVGHIDVVGTAANPVTKTFPVQARIPNPDLSLRSGMIASMRIVLTSSEGLVVPADALLGEPTNGAVDVYVVDGGVARRIPIRVGRRLDREVEVLDGLSRGQQVVIYGKESLTDGAPIETYQEKEPG